MNTVNITGNITRDIDLMKTANGKSTCRFTVAVYRTKEETDYITVSAWNNTADRLAAHARKGTKVAVSGSLRTGSYKGKDGLTKYTWEVLANSVEILAQRSETRQEADPYADFNTGRDLGIGSDDLPF